MPVHQYLGHVDHVERSPCHQPPAVTDGRKVLLLDGQVHQDTHAIPMGNYVIGVRKYVIATPLKMWNYMSADSSAGASALARITTCRGCAAPPGSPAAPGLRPWRGSQLHRGRASDTPVPGGQRRGFGPGEDHNTLDFDAASAGRQTRTRGSAGASALARITTTSAPLRGRVRAAGSAGASALARITTPATGSSVTPTARAAPGLRPWRGSQHRRRRT